jgi:hypothetical protein
MGMALTLWQGQVRLGDVYAHGVVAKRRSGHPGCILAFVDFCFESYRPEEALELRNGKGERVSVRALSLVRRPAATLVAEFDDEARFDWGGPARVAPRAGETRAPGVA